MSESMQREPLLKGVRVLDLTHVVAGPYATMYLAMMGAEVIKVENPKTGGDISRTTGPIYNDTSAWFSSINHNKSSVAIDLSKEAGKKLFLRLVEKSDIVVDNFRVGVMDKLGIGYETMKEVNPKIVYGSISGFGTYGPYRDYPAYDTIAQALSGIMWINGREEDPPMRVGTSIGDVIAGLNMAIGLLAAFRSAEKTGQGQFVEVALVDSLVSSIFLEYIDYFTSGKASPRTGNSYRLWYPYGCYKAKDGYYVLGIGTTKFFKALMSDIIGRPDIAQDPQMATHESRRRFKTLIDKLIDNWAAELTVQEACKQLHAAGIPCARVNRIEDCAQDEHVSGAREMFLSYEQPGIGPFCATNIPLRFHEAAAVRPVASQRLGESTGQTLEKVLGLLQNEIAVLRKNGVIFGDEK